MELRLLVVVISIVLQLYSACGLPYFDSYNNIIIGALTVSCCCYQTLFKHWIVRSTA